MQTPTENNGNVRYTAGLHPFIEKPREIVRKKGREPLEQPSLATCQRKIGVLDARFCELEELYLPLSRLFRQSQSTYSPKPGEAPQLSYRFRSESVVI